MNTLQRIIAAMTAGRRTRDKSGITSGTVRGDRTIYRYVTYGTCATAIDIELIGDKIARIAFTGGCPGNLFTLGRMVVGMKIDKVIGAFHGIKCRNGTSCTEQLAIALKEIRQLRDAEDNGTDMIPESCRGPS